VQSRTDSDKWEYLKHAPARDMHHTEIRRLASVLRCAAGDDVRFAALAHTVARDWIRYQTDTARVGREDLGHPVTALVRGVDDCDAKARLFVALCLAAGLTAEMRDRWRGDELAHVYAAVKLEGKWHTVELTLTRARIGDELPDRVGPGELGHTPGETIPKETNGQWLLT